ncbi:MAG TPA: hypothetical protein VGK67_20580 [Myxococcales bacterium]
MSHVGQVAGERGAAGRSGGRLECRDDGTEQVHGAARRLPSNIDVASKAADGSAELSDTVPLTDRELDYPNGPERDEGCERGEVQVVLYE